MNLFTPIQTVLFRRKGRVARFPFGQQGDPLFTMLPAHMEAIPITSVVGSVDRYTQLDERFQPLQGVTPRLRGICRAMKDGAHFPPIEIYRLNGLCYVVDGHHRVAAALHVGQLYLDALVTECMLSGELAVQGVDEARIGFGLRTGLRSLAFTKPAHYQQALNQIHEHRWYLGERGRPADLREAAQDWHEAIFLPVIRQVAKKRLSTLATAAETGDLYLQLCDLKYSISRERGHDIGFAQTIREWAAKQHRRTSSGMLRRFFDLTTLAIA